MKTAPPRPLVHHSHNDAEPTPRPLRAQHVTNGARDIEVTRAEASRGGPDSGEAPYRPAAEASIPYCPDLESVRTLSNPLARGFIEIVMSVHKQA